MLLAADVGNTEIVLGVFRGTTLEHTWRLSTQPERTPDELALTLSGFLAQRGMAFESQVTGLVDAGSGEGRRLAEREEQASSLFTLLGREPRVPR